MTGRPLGLTNDQIIETTHQYVNHTKVSSNYTIRDLESEIHGEKLLRRTSPSPKQLQHFGITTFMHV